MPLRVEQLRGGLVETVHAVSASLSDGERTLWSAGPDVACFWRSGCKPLQLFNSLSNLPPAIVASLAEEDLAVGTSSHSGEAHHVARVRALLARFELDPAGLRCGADWPMHEAARLDAIRTDAHPSPVYNNCSGKHTFMLAACASRGWDPEYLPLAHPLQQGNLAHMRAWCDAEPGVGVDGCGVPSFHLPVRAMARGFGRLAIAMADGDGVYARVGWAMARRPELVSGTARLDLAVTRAATEPLACKIGAEGLFCIAMPARRQALVVKVHSGNAEALAIAVRAVIDQVCPVLPSDMDWPWATVRNVVGMPVGERRAVWEA